MKNDQQNQGQSQSQPQLETIFRENASKFGTLNDANTFLKQHGLTANINGDTVEIYDVSKSKVATVMLQGDQSNRQIKSISY